MTAALSVFCNFLNYFTILVAYLCFLFTIKWQVPRGKIFMEELMVYGAKL